MTEMGSCLGKRMRWKLTKAVYCLPNKNTSFSGEVISVVSHFQFKIAHNQQKIATCGFLETDS